MGSFVVQAQCLPVKCILYNSIFKIHSKLLVINAGKYFIYDYICRILMHFNLNRTFECLTNSVSMPTNQSEHLQLNQGNFLMDLTIAI